MELDMVNPLSRSFNSGLQGLNERSRQQNRLNSKLRNLLDVTVFEVVKIKRHFLLFLPSLQFLIMSQAPT